MALTLYEHNFKDLFKMLFYKKNCPNCTKKMKRKYEKKKYTETNPMWMEYDDGNTYKIKYFYYCDYCKLRIKVSNLGKKNDYFLK